MNGNYALLIGADLPMRERSILCTARALKKPVVLLAYPGEPMAQRRRGAFALADDIIVSPYLLNPQFAVEAIARYKRETGEMPSAVIPVNDFVLPAAAAIARYAGLPFLSDDVILRCRDKLLMKDALASTGLNVAKTLFIGREVGNYVWNDTRPVIFKPTAFGGSGGVRLVSNRDELALAIEHASALLQKYKDILHIDPTRIHLEQFLDGEREVSVEVYCTPSLVKAMAVTDKQLSCEPYFAEIGHIVPYRGSNYPELADAAERACQALGIDRGVAHVELKLVAGVPYVIEVGARPAGDKIIDLVDRALGIDLYALHALSYIGSYDVPPEPKQKGVAAVTFLKARPGRISAIRTSELPDYVREITLYKGVGDISAEFSQNFETREGHVEWFWSGTNEDVPDFMAESARLADSVFEVVSL